VITVHHINKKQFKKITMKTRLEYFKEYPKLGMNTDSDGFLLPIQYKTVVEEPVYKGDGVHSVGELQKEYCHQQAIIKNNLIIAIKES